MESIDCTSQFPLQKNLTWNNSLLKLPTARWTVFFTMITCVAQRENDAAHTRDHLEARPSVEPDRLLSKGNGMQSTRRAGPQSLTSSVGAATT